MFHHVREQSEHAPLECRGSVAQSEGHASVGEGSEWAGERSLLLVFCNNGDLIVSQVPIRKQ